MTFKKDLTDEVSNFIAFLDKLNCFSLPVSKKEEPHDRCETPTIYKNGIINLAIVFVGDSDIIRRTHYGYEPYVNFIQRMSKEGVDTFYLLARGRLNTMIADVTAKIVEDMGILRMTDRYTDNVKIHKNTIDVILLRLVKNQRKSLLPF